jgi:hypothetical protein
MIKKLIITAGLLASVSMIYFLLSASESPKEDTSTVNESTQKGKNENVAIVPVETQAAFTGDLIISIQSRGVGEALHEVPVILKMSGYAKVCNVWNGKKIKKGDLLVGLKNREQAIALSESRSALIKALIDFGVQVDYPDSAAFLARNILNASQNSEYRKTNPGQLKCRYYKKNDFNMDSIFPLTFCNINSILLTIVLFLLILFFY